LVAETSPGRALDTVVSDLREAGALVLTARLPDPGRMFGLPGALSHSLAGLTYSAFTALPG
jgi:hypothetical protein